MKKIELKRGMGNMLTSVFGISTKYEAWNHQDSLPVYIAGSYDFHTAYIGNRRCIMLTPTEELATLPALKKQKHIWRLLSEDNSADDSSIVLSFGDTNDERIEEAVLWY